jgi:hypothetical protein
LVQCLFPLSSLFLCVAYSCAVVDEKDHTTGAIQGLTVDEKRVHICPAQSCTFFLQYCLLEYMACLTIFLQLKKYKQTTSTEF